MHQPASLSRMEWIVASLTCGRFHNDPWTINSAAFMSFVTVDVQVLIPYAIDAGQNNNGQDTTEKRETIKDKGQWTPDKGHRTKDK